MSTRLNLQAPNHKPAYILTIHNLLHCHMFRPFASMQPHTSWWIFRPWIFLFSHCIFPIQIWHNGRPTTASSSSFWIIAFFSPSKSGKWPVKSPGSSFWSFFCSLLLSAVSQRSCFLGYLAAISNCRSSKCFLFSVSSGMQQVQQIYHMFMLAVRQII